jgi:hypothetical protein
LEAGFLYHYIVFPLFGEGSGLHEMLGRVG